MSLLFLKFIDGIRGKGERRISDSVRQIISYSVLKILGVKVEVRGDTYSQGGSKGTIFAEPGCHLLTFSHASNLDGFIVSAAVPINHIAIAKKELFLIPFFSWISLAFGGLPVDRENRDRAIAALKKATDAAASDECGLKTAIVIAPEGTRSTSGQLLDLKKGTFHIWDQMQCPIVPLVTIGAFDLYPPGSMVTRTGKVYTTFLPPIPPSAASNRDDMLRLVRRRILEHLAEPSPDDLCSDISIGEKASSWLLGLSTILFDYVMFKAGHYILLTHYGLSIGVVAIGSILTSILITVGLYIYFVYIASSLSSSSSSSSSSNKKKTSSSYSETWIDNNDNTNKDD
jgi:1-acyl-sn-glycerol-3-phosphate acyltransferase